jgi:hypothetical protein
MGSASLKIILKLCKCVNISRGTAVAQWLRYCPTNQKVAGLIPDDVMEFFIYINLLIALWPWGQLSL